MARQVARGEIWIIDLGMAATPRPCVILSVPFRDDEKAVVTYVARTSRVSGGRFEVKHEGATFLPGCSTRRTSGPFELRSSRVFWLTCRASKWQRWKVPCGRGSAFRRNGKSKTPAKSSHRPRNRRAAAGVTFWTMIRGWG
jgi:mRNA-degrading endonuclease toxin of MazEF toxin-antitoxin module